jgi:hypothetical protein
MSGMADPIFVRGEKAEPLQATRKGVALLYTVSLQALRDVYTVGPLPCGWPAFAAGLAQMLS